MSFKQFILNYLSTTDNPTMKELFDKQIQYANDHDPEFVKAYKWPTSTPEGQSERQPMNSDLTRSVEKDLIDINHDFSSKETPSRIPVDLNRLDTLSFLKNALEALGLLSDDDEKNNEEEEIYVDALYKQE